MNNSHFIYPANPANVPDTITQTSASFKKEVSAVMGNIVLFFIVYILLFVLSVGLVIGCFYAGVAIIVAVPRFITILAGLGLMGMGIMIFVFLVKFLFAVSRYDRSGIIEITEQEQPKLFAFIRQLTNDTQTAFPKKIYLSPDVNACVFYDSSFWSMFLPIRKNLQIGLGLVNSLNISEFKAVMAHEFGHFSQRSMKLGSFVYNVNRIIHNMLFENNSYSRFLSSWASVSDVLALFANITASIAGGIQSILREMYGLINKRYMSLSREMEFHADVVAASVSGGNNLVGALRRIEMAGAAYNVTIQKCDEFYKQKKISSNIYNNQLTVLKKFSEDFDLRIINGLPLVNKEFLDSNNLSRVNYKDQWASHPATEEREKHLDDLGVNADVLHEPAWVIFENKEQLQAELTQKIYENVDKTKETVTIDESEFAKKLNDEAKTFTLPGVYKNFFDARQIAVLKREEITNAITDKIFSDLINDETAALPKKIASTASDLEILKAIAAKKIRTKTFDFDGAKYKQEDAPSVTEKLEAEQKEMQQRLEDLDRQVVYFFYNKAKQKSEPGATILLEKYIQYFERRGKADDFLKLLNALLDNLMPVYAGQTIHIGQIEAMITTLKERHEKELKGWLKRWLAVNAFILNPDAQTKAEKFIESGYRYFKDSSFFENELRELHAICNESWTAVNNHLFLQFKSILEMQLQYI